MSTQICTIVAVDYTHSQSARIASIAIRNQTHPIILR